MHRQISDLSRENVLYGIRSNSWTHGKWSSLQTDFQRGRKKIRRVKWTFKDVDTQNVPTYWIF